MDVADPGMSPEPIPQRSALSDRHLRSLLEEAVHDAATDPAPAAGHQGDLACELHGAPSRWTTNLAPVAPLWSPTYAQLPDGGLTSLGRIPDPARCAGPRRAGVHDEAFHRTAVGGLRPAPQASIERSLKGLEQQMRALFWAISRGLMPPLCCMSTVPERMVVLQVPHMP